MLVRRVCRRRPFRSPGQQEGLHRVRERFEPGVVQVLAGECHFKQGVISPYFSFHNQDRIHSEITLSYRRFALTGIYAYNLDGRDFIRKAVEDLDATVISAPVSTPATYRTFDHFVMNLPAIALEFLGICPSFIHTNSTQSLHKLTIRIPCFPEPLHSHSPHSLLTRRRLPWPLPRP
ncbi:hypothetical protein BC938DRAFT_476851 [Jimgerdemannia flammicorona]|uniref:Uncharacterized protein n=1 Tax=Jimgerdemannia flammicorona TaxID=994334 RepID=A0A433PDT6_9FUNG|nr:hypothetical protein BC938DRAFT_476851 [Jimgerdemannia flammicorona]